MPYSVQEDLLTQEHERDVGRTCVWEIPLGSDWMDAFRVTSCGNDAHLREDRVKNNFNGLVTCRFCGRPIETREDK